METSLPSSGQRKYFIRDRFILRVLGVSLSENESLAYKIYSNFLFWGFIFAYPVLASGDLFKHEFDVVAELYVYVVGSGMGSLITLVVFRKKERLGRLIRTLENEPFIANPERGGEVEEKLISAWNRFSIAQGLIFFVGVVVSLGSKIVCTFILRLRSSDYHDWRFSFGPFTVLNVRSSPTFEISWFYQSVSLMCIGCTMSSCTVILAFISVQFKILQNNLRRLLENSYKLMFRDDLCSGEQLETSAVLDPAAVPWGYLKICVKEAVLYHLKIFKIIREMEDLFSILMLSIYLCTLSLLCFEVYRASMLPIDDPRMLLLLIEASSVCFQVGMICFCGELVAQESEAVGRAAAEAHFVGADLRFQKALVFIIRRSQDPMRIKAGKFIETSLVTFAWILRGTYSAFMMLRNVKNKQHI